MHVKIKLLRPSDGCTSKSVRFKYRTATTVTTVGDDQYVLKDQILSPVKSEINETIELLNQVLENDSVLMVDSSESGVFSTPLSPLEPPFPLQQLTTYAQNLIQPENQGLLSFTELQANTSSLAMTTGNLQLVDNSPYFINSASPKKGSINTNCHQSFYNL